jgi:hypothetical protein
MQYQMSYRSLTSSRWRTNFGLRRRLADREISRFAGDVDRRKIIDRFERAVGADMAPT